MPGLRKMPYVRGISCRLHHRIRAVLYGGHPGGKPAVAGRARQTRGRATRRLSESFTLLLGRKVLSANHRSRPLSPSMAPARTTDWRHIVSTWVPVHAVAFVAQSFYGQ